MVKRHYKEPSPNPFHEFFKQPLPPPSGNLPGRSPMPENDFDRMKEHVASYKVEVYLSECNIGALASFQGGRGRVAPINFLWRNPACLPPPIQLPDFPDIPEPEPLPGGDCFEVWGFWVRVEDNIIISVGEGNLSEQAMAAAGAYFRFEYNDNGATAKEYDDIGGIEELYGFINYTSTISYSNGNRVTDFPRPNYYNNDEFSLTSYPWALLSASCTKPKPRQPDPPPPPPMTCNCCPNVQQNDELLRLILKRIGEPQIAVIFDEDMEREGSQLAVKREETLFNAAKLNLDRTEITNRLIGIENFPVKVPTSVINPHKEGVFAQIFDFFEDKEREIKTLTELVTWIAEQDNAVLGQFHQVIEFEKGIDKDGNSETETVVLPNVAETLKEIILLVAQLANNDGTKIHALVKLLAETNNMKVNLFKTMQTVIDIQDYLDYPTNSKQVQVDLSCNLKLNEQKDDFEDFFSESKGSFVFEDWNGESSLHDNMLDLLQMAAMFRAMFYQRDKG